MCPRDSLSDCCHARFVLEIVIAISASYVAALERKRALAYAVGLLSHSNYCAESLKSDAPLKFTVP